jgi:5-methylcytosine-specific restriction endonuclease McrA
MRRSPLSRRSAKKEKADRLRAWLRREFLAVHPACERCGQPASDVHEIIRRSQAKDAALRPELYVALCRACHEWATVNPEAAHEAGYVLWSWEDDLQSLERARALRRLL